MRTENIRNGGDRSQAMHKSSNAAAAMLLLCASSAAFAGNPSIGGTLRDMAEAPRASNGLRSVSIARVTALAVPRAAAPTPASKVTPLDQPRTQPHQETNTAPGTDGTGESRLPPALNIKWQTQAGPVNPHEIVSQAHNIRRSGLPIVHLWQSQNNLVALGLSPHGVPGVYFTQRLGNAASTP
jgi:hypothetical protein